MYLNDAFDVEFDRLNRSERPIPSGAISVGDVWGYGFVVGPWAGADLFFQHDDVPLAVALVFSILLYDAVHKAITFSPVIMAACRFFLFLLAASVAGTCHRLSVWTRWRWRAISSA